MKLTYADVIELLEVSPEKFFFVPVFFGTGTMEWMPVDKNEYVRQLRLISKPETYDYPCMVEIEHDGELFLHPKAENKLLI